MTDDWIIKAMEVCKSPVASCRECPYRDYTAECTNRLLMDALEWINRLQTELGEYRHLATSVKNGGWTSATLIRAEAFKEFAEKVKQTICDNTYPDFDRKGKPVNVWNAVNGYKAIDGLVDVLLNE